MKDTFDKIHMDEEKKEEIRKMLGEGKAQKARRPGWVMPVRVLATAAALIAVILIIPTTRNMVVSAAERLGFKKTKSGVEIDSSSSVDENGNRSFSIQFSTPDTDKGKYAQVKDGRLYLAADGNWTDVTDKCSATGYYKYETKDNDGDKVVIYVGGTVDENGSLEFTYDKDGQVSVVFGYLDNQDATWVDAAFKNEGISDYKNGGDEGYAMIQTDDSLPGFILYVRSDE